ncbi:MAG: EamA family transporter [Victivallaceae bacterium]|nr:EamA family transporter [Victivallaceae bacterium]
MAIVYALICLLLTAVNDIVFKFYARKPRPRGLFIMLIGIIWILALLYFPPAAGWNMRQTLLWGGISGIFSVGANILLIEAMGKESAGMCSTIYRLNLVLVVPGAAVLLHEHLALLQYLGVLLAIFAISAFMPRGKTAQTHGASSNSFLARTGVWMVLAAAIMRAGMGLSYRYGFLHGADRNAVVQINALFWIFGGAIYTLLREPETLRCWNRKLLGYGAISGLLVAGIVFFMAASLQLGNAAVVLPLQQMSFLLTFALSVWLLKEKITVWSIAALTSGVGAILLLAL